MFDVAAVETALALLDYGLLHRLLQDNDVELAFNKLHLTLAQLVLPSHQELFLQLLLRRSTTQLILSRTQLLINTTCTQTYNSCTYCGWLNNKCHFTEGYEHLFLEMEVIKERLYLLLPVVLQGVKRLVGCLRK